MLHRHSKLAGRPWSFAISDIGSQSPRSCISRPAAQAPGQPTPGGCPMSADAAFAATEVQPLDARRPSSTDQGRAVTGRRQLSLRGRSHECGVLDRLVQDVSSGRSGAVVLRGEPGVGKTALLDYAVESASGLTVVRSVGVESEMELPFAAVHQLCAPMLDRLD